MRRLLFCSILFFSVALISCNHTKTISSNSIPKNILATFTVMFPKAKDIRWYKVSDFIYQSNFMSHKEKMTARYNLNGIWQRTTKIIKKADLPVKVINALDKHYKKAKITSVSVINDSYLMVYAIEINQNGHQIQLSYDKNGSLMSHILN